MIQILIIDDNPHKLQKIAEKIESEFGTKHVVIKNVASTSEAMKVLENEKYDLMILDINLPLREGAPPSKDGGLKLLQNLVKRGEQFTIPTHIVGLTAFEDLKASFDAEFAKEGWQLVTYDDTSNSWEDPILNKISYVLKQRDGAANYDYDFAIITAVRLEFDAVLALLKDKQRHVIPSDDTIYYVGSFSTARGQLKVIAACCAEMGMAAASALTMKVCISFKPRYAVLAGIAAGFEVQPGDILIAERCWNYDAGKIKEVEGKEDFLPEYNSISIAPSVREKLADFITHNGNKISGIQGRSAIKVNHALSAHLGPLVSGSAVVESKETVAFIKAPHRKTLGLDMETYGFYLAASEAPAPKPQYFSAKSMCDKGQPPKTDDFQRYAAYTSANFIYEFAVTLSEQQTL